MEYVSKEEFDTLSARLNKLEEIVEYLKVSPNQIPSAWDMSGLPSLQEQSSNVTLV